MTTVATRTLYIDSENVQGNTSSGTSFRLNMPPSSFSCKPNQIMKLTLTNFEIRKNWYEVNQTNNVFWLETVNTTTITTNAVSTNVIPVNDATGIATSQSVSGIGIPAGTTVSAVNGLNIGLSQPITVASGTSVSFTNTQSISTTAATTNGQLLTFSSTSVVVVGASVSGTGIPPNTIVVSKTSTIATLNNVVTVANAASITFTNQVVCVTTAGSYSVLPTASTLGAVVGQQVAFTGIPQYTTIAAIAANTSITLSTSVTTTVPSSSAVLVDAALRYYPCVIPPGSYRSFGTTTTMANTVVYNTSFATAVTDSTLCSGIAYAVQKTCASIHTANAICDATGLTAAANQIYPAPAYNAATFFSAAPATTVTFNAVTRKFTITFNGTAANFAITKLVFLQCKSGLPGTHPMISYVNNFNKTFGDPTFQDSYELLGGVPSRDAEVNNTLVLTVDIANNVNSSKFVSPYVGQLNTLEAIYIRLLSQSTNNFQSPGLDRSVPNNYGLVPTNIFARVPLPQAVYDDVVELLTFSESSENTFTCIVDARSLQSIEFGFTDDKGRPLQEVLTGQFKSGDLSAKLTIRFDIVQFEQSLNTLPPSMDIIKSLTPVGYVRPNTDDILPPFTDKETILKRPRGQPAFAPKMTLMNN